MAKRPRKAGHSKSKKAKHAEKSKPAPVPETAEVTALAGALHACVVNRGWREVGKASILVARTIGPQRTAMAAFLVDLWAMGLKDAYGRTDISFEEFDECVAEVDAQLGTCPLNIGTARDLVYGGIELARELGFRLPRRYERWTAILGPLPDGESPDMSLFRYDGKIRLECSTKDLESRLVGISPEEFLARPDVDAEVFDDEFTLVDDEADALDDMISQMEEAMVDRAKQWCFANGQTPHPLLSKMVGAFMEAVVQGLPPDYELDERADPIPEAQSDQLAQQAASFLAASFEDDPEALSAAMTQFDGFVKSLGSPEDLIEGFGLDD
jgi:hypothetical protein